MTTLVIGASGLVGYEFYRQNKNSANWHFTYNTHKLHNFIQLDATDPEQVKNIMKKSQPQTVIVPAAMPNVNLCETDKESARRINVGIIENVLNHMPKNAKIVFFSSDYIFDGESGPYSEEDQPNPINNYGRIKLECENKIKSSGLGFLIIRTTNIFGWEMQGKNFLYRVITTLDAGKELAVPNDQFGNPTYVKDLVAATRKLLESNQTGVFNIVGPNWMSRDEFARTIAHAFSLDTSLITNKPTSQLNDIAPRPLRAGFKTDKIHHLGIKMLHLKDALEDMKTCKSIDNVYN